MEIEQLEGEWTRLPITECRNDIVKAIQDNAVVVIEGETGCGKTTQVPKYILEANPKSRIIVTQPRRLAATSVATRVAHELGSRLGDRVGYHIGMDCRATEHTKITYVTNGIFLQKLTNDENFLQSYTHFIFDEIHERGLECDFSIIAMKLYLCRLGNPRTKIVLMSATLNSEMFCRFFAKDPQGNFIKSLVVEERDERTDRSGRGRQPRGDRVEQNTDLREWKYKTELRITERDKPATCIKLPSMRKFTISIRYLEDVDPKRRDMGFSEQPDMDDHLVELAAKLCAEYCQRGDVLIFVPGMRQIKRMSDGLEGLKQRCQVIELHSQYSQTAGEQLFARNSKPKIIVSTNIAESSITLPDCKTIIDFCMTKQNNYDERTRFQRLELKWASLASLTQRAGRVGRVSDGLVVRLISRRHMERFSQYEPPEIRRSPLEKTILQIKKLQKLDDQRPRVQRGQGSIFQNPYEVLSNAFEPPEIDSINAAMERLVDEGALVVDTNEPYDDPEFKRMKFNGSSLKITKLGELLVQIPCDIQLAKGLLLSMELCCLDAMLDVAAIAYCTKPFFVNVDKRQQPEQYIHTIVDYDRGEYNDFRLRHRIFASWQQRFFKPWYDKNVGRFFSRKQVEDLDEQDENLYKTEGNRVVNYSKLLNEFQRVRAAREQIEWCTWRCIYANNMREILLFREGLRSKITRGRMNFRADFVDSAKLLDLALNISLFSAFRDSLMLIETTPDEGGINSFLNQQLQPKHSIDVEMKYSQCAKQIEKYVQPEEDPHKKVVEMSQSFFLEASYPILSKFMLPYRYRGRPSGKSSQVFNRLFEKQPYYPYKVRIKDLRNRTEVRIDNDSINGFIPHRSHHQGYLLSNGYFESRSSVSTSCTSYLSATHTVLLLLIFCQSGELVHHESHEFFSRLKLSSYTVELPIFIDEAVLQRVAQLKRHLREIFELGKRDAMNEQLLREFRSVLEQQYESIPVVDRHWEQMHIQERVKQVEHPPSSEIAGIRFTPTLPGNNYHNDFNEWRANKLTTFERFVDRLKFETAKFVCRDCHPARTSVLCEAESCQPQKKLFKYNAYDDSWHVQGREIMCSAKKHRVGRMVGEDEVRLEEEGKLLLLYPDLSTERFSFSEFSLDQVKRNEEQIMPSVREFRRATKHFECQFCVKEEYSFVARNLQEFMKHTRNKEHNRRLEEFAQGLN